MDTNTSSTGLIDSEAHGLLSRLDQVKPFVMHETMVLAAALPRDAQLSIERFLHTGRNDLRRQIGTFLDWLHDEGRYATAAEQQRRFVLIRLQFNVVLAQFDLFTEVVTQRSEHSTGVWLSGLDILAQDALRVKRSTTTTPGWWSTSPGVPVRPSGGPKRGSPAASRILWALSGSPASA